MKTSITLIITAIIGILGTVFGIKQKSKCKVIEKENEALKTNLEEKKEQAIISQSNDTAHIEDVGMVVNAKQEELVTRANSLFGSKTLGSRLYDYRKKNGWSINTLSKKTGYTGTQLAGFEKNKGITKDAIEKLAKVYALSKEEKKELLSMLEDN